MGPACTLLRGLSESDLALMLPEELAELESLAEAELGLELLPIHRASLMTLPEFARAAWEIVEPATPMSWNWHLDVFAEEAEHWTRNRRDDVVVNIPPGCMKSLWWSVFVPTWVWTWWPESRWMFSSYNGDLSVRDSMKRRQIIESEWYQSTFPVRLLQDQNLKTRFANTASGWMFATSTGGQVTGEHPDFIVIDDPHKAGDVYSEAERESTVSSWDQSFSTRGLSRNVSRLCCMQRLHKDDMAAHLLKQGWRHVCLPMRFEPDRESNHSHDPRTEEGELLWPELFSEAIVAGEESKGETFVASQFQQRPPDQVAGLEWPASYFTDEIYAAEHRWPDAFAFGVIAVDPSKGKDGKKGDYSAILFVGYSGGRLWVDASLERRPVEKIVHDGIELALRYIGQFHAFAIEVNGFQELIKDEYERQITERHLMPLPIVPIENKVNKKLRISRLGPYFANKKIVIRDNEGGRLLVKQCSTFSMTEQSGVHDDGPDCLEMAIRVGIQLQGGEGA
jgi:predicted phage terminase large subunit-like protein